MVQVAVVERLHADGEARHACSTPRGDVRRTAARVRFDGTFNRAGGQVMTLKERGQQRLQLFGHQRGWCASPEIDRAHGMPRAFDMLDLRDQCRQIALGARLRVLHHREIAIRTDAIAKRQMHVASGDGVVDHAMNVAPTAPGPACVPTVGPTAQMYIDRGATAADMRCATPAASSGAMLCSTAMRTSLAALS